MIRADGAGQLVRAGSAAPAGNAGELFCHFVRSLCENPRGEKQLKMTRDDLALQLGCNRRRMSELIVSWQKAGLANLSYSQIAIPDLKRLQNYRPPRQNTAI